LRGRLPRPALWSLAALAALLALAVPAAEASAACPNEVRRVEQGATGLPGCRAFELVTPPGAALGKERIARAAAGGGAVTYYTNQPAPDAVTSAYFYLAKRGADGWSTQSVGPQNMGGAQFSAICEQNLFFSPDLSKTVLEAGWFDAFSLARCKRHEPIVPDEPTPYRNVFLHDFAAGSTELVNLTPAGATPENAKFQDASDDFTRIVFGEESKLTADAPEGFAFYLWHEGALRPVTVLPDGSPAAGALVEATPHRSKGTFVEGSGFAPLTGAVSSDGRRLFFYSGDGLYLRENPEQPQSAVVAGECLEPARACTVQVDASQGPGASGGGVFWRATDDASSVLFSADRKLTADSTAEPGKADLYRYDVDSGELTDLTADGAEPADVRGVVGAAEDGSRVYFVANGALAPGALPGGCNGDFETTGECSLYALQGGTVSFVARLSGKEPAVWQEGFEDATPRTKGNSFWANASPNGEHLAFVSSESLTGYDNFNPVTQSLDRELFLYSAGAGLSCVSCPAGPPQDPVLQLASAGNYGPNQGSNASWRRRAVLDDGTVFLTTRNPLASEDADGEEDVYQYREGTPHLLSRGVTTGRSVFLDASADGAEVFFRSHESLVARDRDGGDVSLYVAREGGGFAEPPPPPPACAGEGCRPPSALPPQIPVPVTSGTRAKAPKPCRRARPRPRRCAKPKNRQAGKHGRGKAGKRRGGRGR
jgi:hypothetical protein